jgi:CBS domain-containing protein
VRPHECKVDQFMSRDVLTVHPEALAASAVKVMVDHKVGSVVVEEGGRIHGLLTEWGLLAALPRQGLYPEPSLVKNLTMLPATSVTPQTTLAAAAGVMTQGKPKLTVLEAGHLVGMVTATDVVRQLAALEERFSIDEVVSRHVATVGYNSTVGLAIQHMVEKRMGSVLVCKTSSIYGIFTERDALVKVIAPTLPLRTRVGELATFPLMVAQAGIDGLDAARIMSEHRIKKLPLFKGEKLVGILTARDVVEAFSRSPTLTA